MKDGLSLGQDRNSPYSESHHADGAALPTLRMMIHIVVRQAESPFDFAANELHTFAGEKSVHWAVPKKR
jgi:hypothetical protein